MSVTLVDVQRAQTLIAGHVLVTPFLKSDTLSSLVGANVWAKFENHQFTASFKERGACHRLMTLDEGQRARGVIAPSAGNFAQGLARHAQRFSIPCTIVMPRATPAVKIQHTEAFGARVVLAGDSFDEARVHAEQLALQTRLTMVPPFDDNDVIAGQGTCALEMLAACPALDTLVVPVGGGGLIAGMAVAAKALRPQMRVVGVQAARFPAMANTLAGVATTFSGPTVADGIAVKQPGVLTVPIVRQFVDEFVLVDEDAIEEAILLLLEIEKTVVEGAGAVGLAALRAHARMFAGRTVGIVLSGGNIDPMLLSSIIERGLVRSGRLVRIRIGVRDLPGALGDVTRLLGEQNANIDEVVHQRAFSHLPVATAEVDFVLRTRGHEHVDAVVAALAQAGYVATVVS